MSCYVFFAHVFSAVSVGVRCRVWTFRGQPAASSFPSSPGSQNLVPHSLLLFVVLGDIEVSLVLVDAAVCFASVSPRPIVPFSSLSLLACSFSSPLVHQPSQHLRSVPAVAQDRGVKWEAWGPVSHEGPWGPVQGQQQAP